MYGMPGITAAPAGAGLAQFTGTLTLTGRPSKPEIYIETGYSAVHPVTGKSLKDWFKEMPDARWQKAIGQWKLTGTPRHPDRVFQDAGLQIIIDPVTMQGITCLQDVYPPLSKLDPNGRTVAVRHRLAGYVEATHLLGWAAVWDKEDELIRIPVTDVFQRGQLRPGIQWDQPSIDAAYRALTQPVVRAGFEEAAANLGRALCMGDQSRTWADSEVASLPDWWGIQLFPYQHPGALSAVLGHRLLADPPGVGKTLTAIAAAAMLRADRILITCPPLLAIGWGREFEKAGYPHPIAIFQSGRKQPEIPETGVVIVPDSMLTSKANGPALRQKIIDWKPQAFAVDEAHRMKNLFSQRTQAILDISVHVPVEGRIPMTGTPVISGPAELVPILEFTGHLGPIFGGADAFLQRFCTKNPFGKFNPRKANLNELHHLMQQWVWVRRDKERVLPFLPKKMHGEIALQVDTKLYREAHDEVMEKITDWLREFTAEYGAMPGPDEIDEYVSSSVGFVSQLRKAAALTKVGVATDMVLEHIAADPDNSSPLITWVHHREVAFALAEQLEELGVEYRMLIGGVSAKDRQNAIDDYQAGKVQCLIAGLTSAGVGVTLTRGFEALFIETDWTPAIVSQAIDRQRRIGQERAVIARTMIALNTLDEHIQRVQKQKQDTAGAIHGDDQSDVALLTGSDLISTRELMRELVDIVIAKHMKLARSRS